MTRQSKKTNKKVHADDADPEGWLKDIKHRMECSQCEHAYYVHSEGTWYCPRQRRLTEGYCEY